MSPVSNGTGDAHARPAWTPPTPLFPVDLENAPSITLAGRAFKIPKLAIKQKRVVMPGLMRLLPFMTEMQSLFERRTRGEVNDEQLVMEMGAQITTERIDLMSDIVHTALTRGTPGFARGEFDEMPIEVMELVLALDTISLQTGMMERKKIAAGETQPAAPVQAAPAQDLPEDATAIPGLSTST